MAIKPPLGLIPRWIRDEERIMEIKNAINRHFFDDYPIMQEWVDEYNEIAKRMQKRKEGDTK